jgi:hypothetical protein
VERELRRIELALARRGIFALGFQTSPVIKRILHKWRLDDPFVTPKVLRVILKGAACDLKRPRLF